MTKINYKSDFDFILRLKDCADPKKTVPFPDGDFDARFWTSSKANAYTASYRDGVYTNCFRTEDGGMHFVFDDHRMGKGTLHWEPHFELPNDIYPDNMQDLYRKAALDIELVDGDGDCPTTAELEAMLPYIKGPKGDKGDKGDKGNKGDAFTYDDFTPEQIADLKRPATEAAQRLQEFQTTAEANESEREEAEEKRAEEFAAWHDEIAAKQDALTTTEDLQISEDNELSLTDKAKMRLFIDQWDAAWKVSGTVYGKYDPENAPDAEHPFMGNEIWMTYDEAILVMEYSSGFSAYQIIYLVNIPIKTLLPIPLGPYNTSVDIMSMNELRTIRFIDALNKGYVQVISQHPWFISNCPNLTKIEGRFNISNMGSSSCARFLRGSVNIKEFRASGLNKHLNLITNSKLSLATMQYLVDNASTAITAEKPVVVTVHADVFAKLTGDTTNEAAAALADDEKTAWAAVLTAATSKYISFATD